MGDAPIKRLFTRLGAEFGHKFYSAMPTDEAEQAARAIWAERLAGLSLEEMRKGVDKLREYAERNNGWPPGAAEFRELCRPRRETYERAEFQSNALEQKTASKQTAKQYLAQLRGRVAPETINPSEDA